MEEQMQELKKNLSKGELADFVFTEKMKMNILQETKNRRLKPTNPFFQLSSIVPRGLSLAAMILFAAGIFYIVTSGMDPGANPGRNADPEIVSPKPVLVSPSYVPAGYVFKHTHTDGTLYEHIYVKETNEEEYFSYTMQEKSPEANGKLEMELQLTRDLSGQVYKLSNDHTMVLWKDEGFYQSVEQFGDMSSIEFYRIVDSIFEAKGQQSVVDQHIEKLEADRKAAEEEQAKLAFDKEKAIALLEKYNTTRDAAFADSYTEDFKFNTYKTKEEFYALFTDFMSRDHVESTFSFRVDERADGLYNLPTETPRTFWPEEPYEFERVSETEYKLTQSQNSDLNGKEEMIVIFKHTSDKWFIESIHAVPTY